MPRILLIDDDEHLAPPLTTYLKRFDFELAWAPRPSVGLARLREEAFDAAILDVMLPEMDGFELLRTIRQGGEAMAELPIVMLTARGELPDKVVGLELGADDYLPKPFEPRELAARLHTVLRRHRVTAASTPTHVSPPDQLCFEEISIDLARREVRRQGCVVDLTGTEFELLALLAGEPRKVFSRDEILNRLRGHDAELATRAVDILVSRLRRKLEPLDCIKTLRNAGYAFAGAPSTGSAAR
ncbi:response regulator transcription factor [Ideonella sp. DXS29W]|uniref:Response regulator transcription factor n=1 Tax=Ideonella lacteola TaxID=2984193 RepID=A0ABU9BL23_9BURK